MDLFDGLDFGFGESCDEQEKSMSALRKSPQKNITRRIKSEIAMEQSLPFHFVDGETYHCISFGDVDSLSYLRAIVKQQRIRYLALSTWCMAVADAEEIRSWLDAGYIDRADFYVGEIFQGKYADCYEYIKRHCLINGGRICIFRNHSKVMVGLGEKFDFAIASSANINTNPRCENTVITIDSDVARFYKNFFDDVRSFNNDFPNWEPCIDKWSRKGGVNNATQSTAQRHRHPIQKR